MVKKTLLAVVVWFRETFARSSRRQLDVFYGHAEPQTRDEKRSRAGVFNIG